MSDPISIVDHLIAQAIESGASDIHLEPVRDNLKVRYRIDGLLFEQPALSNDTAPQVLARIKVLAHIDVAEKRIPQDGKFSVIALQGVIDLRVSTFPTMYGEKIVIRILDRFATILALESLGFQDLMLQNFKQLLHRPQGFVLVTGPTGSGKTTTLYAALSLIKQPEKNIITLEDPIEYNIDGITQGHINTDIGFTFDCGIRAILRQDPDIIMVGEIRDKQTAIVAIQAALTGHLVLSTLHTNDAPSAVMRLLDMDIPPFLINATVTGILAQRLVRKLCQHCRKPVDLTPDMRELIKSNNLSIAHVYESVGCTVCNNRGFKGRIGIFELLVLSPDVRALIHKNPHCDDIYAQAWADGWRPLIYDAAYKVDQGIIGFDNVLALCN